MVRTKYIKVGGISAVVIDYSLTFDEQVLLMKIRESQRRANIGGIVREPGHPIVSEIPVDVEFSKLCIEGSGWK